MKYLTAILLITLNFSSCNTDKKQIKATGIKESEPKNKTENIPKSVAILDGEKESKINSDNRLNLNKILSSNENEYLASFSDGKLEICCYDEIIDLPESLIRSNFKKTIETCKPQGKLILYSFINLKNHFSRSIIITTRK